MIVAILHKTMSLILSQCVEPALIGWGKYQYIDYLFGCLLVWSDVYRDYIDFTGITFFSAVLVIGFCYINIYITIKRMNRNCAPINDNSAISKLKKEIQNTLWICLTVVTFLLFYMFYVAVRLCKCYMMSDILTQFEYYTQTYLFIAQN